MDTVRDQRRGHGLVGECERSDTGGAVVQTAHPVEQVGHQACTGRDHGIELIRGRSAMADGDQHASTSQYPGGFGREWLLGSERHDGDVGWEGADPFEIDRHDQFWPMRSGSTPEERTFQVYPGDGRSAGCRASHCLGDAA